MKAKLLRDLYAKYPPDVQRVVEKVLRIEKEFLSYNKGTATRKAKGPLDEYISEVAARTLQSGTTGEDRPS